MKKYRSLGLLLVALIFSGIAGFSSIKYLEHREQALIAEFDEKANYTEVIVPNRDLLVGEVVSLETVSVRPVPATYIPNGTLFPSDFDAIAGLALKEPAAAGRPLLRAQLDGLAGVEKFSQLLNPGHRAVTLPIDELQSNENMILPGDYIDILVKLESSGGNSRPTGIGVNSLLSKVLVLATGSTTIVDPTYLQAQGYQQGYASITVGVASKDIPALVSAQEVGDLIFLLRNPEDNSKGRFTQANGLFGLAAVDLIRVFSNGNTNGGLLGDTYRSAGGSQQNRWGNAVDTGRLYKKYQGEFFKEDTEKVKLGQR